MDIVWLVVVYVVGVVIIGAVGLFMVYVLWGIIRLPIIFFSPTLEGEDRFVYMAEDPGFFGFYECLMLDEPEVSIIIDTKKERFDLMVKLTKTEIVYRETFRRIAIGSRDVDKLSEEELLVKYRGRIDSEIADLLADLRKNRKRSSQKKKHIRKNMTKLYDDLRKSDSL